MCTLAIENEPGQLEITCDKPGQVYLPPLGHIGRARPTKLSDTPGRHICTVRVLLIYILYMYVFVVSYHEDDFINRIWKEEID